MKLRLKEDPKEWRKATCLSALGLALLSTVLRWRGVLPPPAWGGALLVLAAVAGCALARPQWFRGYYRVSSRIAFRISQGIGYASLTLFFLVVLTPLGLALRLLGKDLLRLRRPPKADTYWTASRESTPLERLF
jgi:hypothetical protein